ncbi:MAG: sugar ABC transporter ATP-binding protein [Steroidobacteraceae bacterium]|nr:sugar ABC transporter ATP-binding protein [Steroidobacteraceae bacterium]
MTTPPLAANVPLLAARSIVHSYGGKPALDGVDFTLRAGEVHALMGQNGAGKSTLIKVLTGAESLQAGDIALAGKPIRPTSTLDAQRLGISTVYQEVNLCPNLSVAENIFAGRQPRRAWTRGGGIDWRALNARSKELLLRLDVDIDVRRELGGYSVAIQQMVAIARAIDISARVLILDEPTSSLDSGEVDRLFATLKRLRANGLGIVFVTHFLDQVYAVSDRITVLRNGKLVGEHPAAQLDHAALVAAMVGRATELPTARPRAAEAGLSDARATDTVLTATGISRRGSVGKVDLEIRRGEIVGIAGLLGSGRTEVARLLFGLDRADAGSLAVEGKPVSLRDPAHAISHGLGFCPEERKTEGIVEDLSIRDNIVLTLQTRQGLWRRLPQLRVRELTDKLATMLDIRAPDLDGTIGTLSGGNQQKCVIARALATDPCLLILDEPTRGIDVAGKTEIMNRLVELAAAGLAIVFISAEIEELLRVSTRIVVMRDRVQVATLPGGCSADDIYALIATPVAANNEAAA